jgi:hypothetical protein
MISLRVEPVDVGLATGKRSSKAPKAAAAGSSEVERISNDEKIKHEIYLCQIIVHVISCDD